MRPTDPWTTPLRRSGAVTLLGALALVLSVTPAEAKKCKKDAVQVGDACIDRYEASAWKLSSSTDKKTIKKIQNGNIKDASGLAGKAIQRGVSGDDYTPGIIIIGSSPVCTNGGGNCRNLYAVSIPGVMPSRFITWYQATAACRNAGKRLATNQEWQAAALGTPDTGGADTGTTTCNTDSTLAVVATGSRAGCTSDVGVFDMVGNVEEWVADWVARATHCGSWSSIGSDDRQCLAGAATTGDPGALVRGGHYESSTEAGPFMIKTTRSSIDSVTTGFRCARDL